MADKLPTVRRSQLITTYGVGAVVPVESESFIIGGIDDWPTPRDKRQRVVVEPRLARLLGVNRFLSPPSGERSAVPIYRFPELVFCPECKNLDAHYRLADQHSNECRECGRTLVPSRFVACCVNGHIEDFPYFQWVHRGQAGEGKDHNLTLEVRGTSSSLSDILIRCSCGVKPATMQNALGRGSMQGIKRCAGKRPWLETDDAGCDEPLVALQRGSSNVWFSVVRSSLSIPPWSEGAYAFAVSNWDVLSQFVGDDSILSKVISGLRSSESPTVDEVLGAVAALASDESLAMDEKTLRAQEYDALQSNRPESSPKQDFVCEPRPTVASIGRFVDSVSEVSRLREVRVLQSFSRVDAPVGDDASRMAPLSVQDSDWLPAIEVLGEGLFLRLDEGAVQAWENTAFASQREAIVQESLDRRAATLGRAPTGITARKLLVHTLAHVLINELALDTGYPASSIRERIYTNSGQAGVLLYTATADAAGSLGGLCAKGKPLEVSRLLRDAVERARWCSADPVCIESSTSGPDGLNVAACHSCLLLPEVSCECQNTLLDRACLIGLPNDPSGGYFDDLGTGTDLIASGP